MVAQYGRFLKCLFIVLVSQALVFLFLSVQLIALKVVAEVPHFYTNVRTWAAIPRSSE